MTQATAGLSKKPSSAPQVICSSDGEPLYTLVPVAEYARLKRAAEEIDDVKASSNAILGDSTDLIPAEVVHRIADGEIPVRVWRQHRGFKGVELARAAGISPARLSALSVLIFGGPRTLGELATTEQVTAPTMSRLVAGMERDGLVLRKPDPDDKRAVRLRTSARGRRTFDRARRERLDLLGRLIAGCDDDERELLAAAAELIDRLAKKQL